MADSILTVNGKQSDNAGNLNLTAADLTDLAPIDSPAFSGTPTAPTPGDSDSSSKLATTSWVVARIAAIVSGAPGALDTLKELADALGDDPNFATTVTNALAQKQPLDQTLTGIAALTMTANQMLFANGNDTFDVVASTAYMRGLFATANAAGLRTALGLGGAALLSVGTAAGTVAAGDDSRFPLAGFRNKLINGDFRFWQRNTSQTTDGYGSMDRWRMASAGTSAYSTTRQVMGGGALAAFDYEPPYYAQVAVTSGNTAGSAVSISQRIEDVRTYANRTVTVCGLAYADTAGKKMSIELLQNFGTGGSSDVNGIVAAAPVTLSAGWTSFSVTIAVPSIAGKTIGANSFLATNIWFDAGSTFAARTNSIGNQSGTFRLANVQLGVGVDPSAFEVRPTQVELALCQRYYEKSFDTDTIPANNTNLASQFNGASYNSTTIRGGLRYAVTKRVLPTLTPYATPSGGGAGSPVWAYINSGGTYTNATSTGLSNNTVTGFTFDVGGTGFSFGQAYVVTGHWSADAEL